MGKLFGWVVAIVVVWFGVKLLRLSQRRRRSSSGDGPAGIARGTGAVEPMVQCAHCGLHLPSSEAVIDGDRAWCSAAHRDARGSA
jgi:uncharacterized protein